MPTSPMPATTHTTKPAARALFATILISLPLLFSGCGSRTQFKTLDVDHPNVVQATVDTRYHLGFLPEDRWIVLELDRPVRETDLVDLSSFRGLVPSVDPTEAAEILAEEGSPIDEAGCPAINIEGRWFDSPTGRLQVVRSSSGIVTLTPDGEVSDQPAQPAPWLLAIEPSIDLTPLLHPVLAELLGSLKPRGDVQLRFPTEDPEGFDETLWLSYVFYGEDETATFHCLWWEVDLDPMAGAPAP